MFANDAVLFRFMGKYLKRLIADLSPEQMRLCPAPGMNTPHWLLGHLTISNDFTLMQLGQPTICPQRWMVMFGPGSDPARLPEKAPGKEELLEAFDKGAALVQAALPQAIAEEMEKEHPIDFLKPAIFTKGNLVAHLLTTHIGGHVGQLSAWRRAAGLSSVGLPND